MIVFDHVTKQYQGSASGSAAVQDLSITLDRGLITVFVGPSGCGKTTSLRMINRMVDPTSGRIMVDGQDISEVAAPALRRSMGYVMQSSGLMPHRTVLDNIMTVLRLNKVPVSQARERGRELMDTVGLPQNFARRYPSQLSGGQQQRVGVARALAADPPVLLMDEPFSAVDPVVRAELQQELLRLQRELAKTIVFVTHDIDEAMLLGDKVAVFATGGRLAQYDSPEKILRAPHDDFVAEFIGRDRGFRHLSFDQAHEVTVHPLPAVPELAPVSEWTVKLGAQRHPEGWLSPERPGELIAGGSLFRRGESLRQALDSALSSPSGIGVAVDESGALLGGVKAPEVLQAIENARLVREQDANSLSEPADHVREV
ncbi:ATP-binding cassette domain-containing protein [Acaricomes phytoseiuli]|nr:ATP-binding cassette domain-containing protein [Acaricomes phytoseiuli]MCW1250167.1 ATP-binding cassette domain-containing protein [Acaricomes phytoseiuli]